MGWWIGKTFRAPRGAFDFANPDAHSPQRFQTTVPQQSLFLLNSPLVAQQARHLAARPEIASAQDPDERIGRMFGCVFARAPDGDELTAARQFVSENSTAAESAASGPADKAGGNGSGQNLDPWQRLAQALLLTNEFMIID